MHYSSAPSSPNLPHESQSVVTMASRREYGNESYVTSSHCLFGTPPTMPTAILSGASPVPCTKTFPPVHSLPSNINTKNSLPVPNYSGLIPACFQATYGSSVNVSQPLFYLLFSSFDPHLAQGRNHFLPHNFAGSDFGVQGSVSQVKPVDPCSTTQQPDGKVSNFRPYTSPKVSVEVEKK